MGVLDNLVPTSPGDSEGESADAKSVTSARGEKKREHPGEEEDATDLDHFRVGCEHIHQQPYEGDQDRQVGDDDHEVQYEGNSVMAAIEVEVKLSRNDPCLKVLNEIVEILDPFSRLQQLHLLGSACLALGDYKYARFFIEMAEEEAKEKARQEFHIVGHDHG